MKHFLILIFLLFSLELESQNISPTHIGDSSLSLLKEEIRLLKENKKSSEPISEKRMTDLQNEVESKIEAYKCATKDLINLYVFFISTGIVIIGFLVNFFGKSAIKRRVEELITETAQKHIESKILETLNSKITNEVIENSIKSKSEEEINKIIASLEDKGNTAIDQIKIKGDEVIKSMLSSPPKFQVRSEQKGISDDEITIQNNKVRSDELFNLAFNSSDPRIQIELYKNVLELDPNNFNALNNMAFAHNNLNETAESILVVSKAITLNPRHYQAYSNRAQAYNLQDSLELALKDIEVAISLEPKYEYAYAVKGNILTKQGKFVEAESALNTAVQLNQFSAEAYFNRAFFYEERKEYDKSLADYEKSEGLGFDNKAMLYNNFAVLYRRKREFDKAIEFIEKARQFNPDFPNIYGTLALIYADKNEDEAFYANLKLALEKGCPVWQYLADPGFSKYRETKRLSMLIEPYKKKYFA